MSSALKPVLTPSGAQNTPVPAQHNKPMHPQGVPTTYGQPGSHVPQNLANVAHSATNAHNPIHSNVHNTPHLNVHNPPHPNTHNPAHTNMHSTPHHVNTNAHNVAHSTNHYSLNVPNASSHYSMGGGAPASSHPAPVSNHPIPTMNMTQAHSQNIGSYNSPSKNTLYNPSYQANLGHTFDRGPNVAPASQNLPTTQAQQNAAIPQEPQQEKGQSNGTPEPVSAAKPEPPQNHVTSPSKDKPPPPPQAIPIPQQPAPPAPATQQTPEKAKTEKTIVPQTTPPEQKQIVEAKPAETEATPPEKKVESQVNPASADAKPVEATAAPSPVTTTSAVSTAPSAVVPVTVVTPPSPEKATTPEIKEVASTTESSSVSPPKPKEQVIQKPSTMKLATTPRTPIRKPKPPKPETSDSPKSTKGETKSPNQKSPGSMAKTKRNRIRTQPYQSPLPEVEMISKMTSISTPRGKNIKDNLIIFYKNEFLAVRNSEGNFYICQAVQNIYKSSPRIRIRWLSQDKNDTGDIYSPDFYDHTDFDCILTNLNLERVDKGKFKLPASEKERADSILNRAIAVEKGDAQPSLSEEHPDGLDLSLYKEESQLKKRKSVKRKAFSPLKSSDDSDSSDISAEQPKVRKLSSKKAKKSKKTVVAKKVKKAPVVAAPKKSSASGRAERANKRKKESPSSSTKSSPVVDQNKAKVLAKVARKTAVPAAPKTAPVKTSAKASKPPVASSSKGQKPAAKVLSTVRKSKRGKK